MLRASAPSEVLLLINVGVDPLKQHSQKNIHLTSERTDSLNYSGIRENLVLTLDQVCLNSWNELLVSRWQGPSALLDCLSDYLNNLPSEGRRSDRRDGRRVPGGPRRRGRGRPRCATPGQRRCRRYRSMARRHGPASRPAS